jgi:hypothetical protein
VTKVKIEKKERQGRKKGENDKGNKKEEQREQKITGV